MKYQRGDVVPIKVIGEGPIKVDGSTAHVERDCGNVLLVYVNLVSKYAELIATGHDQQTGPLLFLVANEHTLDIDHSKPFDAMTTIEFPEHKGWRIFSVSGPARYTLCVTLIKPDMKNES